jgi:hypothetical protein
VPKRSPIAEYLLSVPERVLRSATALAAGIVRETGDVALPAFVRRTRLYQNLIDTTLRFLIERVGQVEGAYPSGGQLAEDFLLRRTAGNGLELIGVLTFRASPVWVMAALADVSGAGRQLIREIATELQREGLLEPGANFETVEQVLDGLERASARIAETVNTPPLDVKTLREEWSSIRREVASIPAPRLPSADSVWSAWRELQAEAQRQNRPVFELSSLMALSAIARVPEHLLWLGKSAALAARRTGEVFAGAMLDHYSQALNEIHETGYARYWVREFRPYLRAAALQFSPKRRSLTERLLRRGAPVVLLALSLQAQVRVHVAPSDLRAHVEFLASDFLAGRATPSPGLDVAAQYIAAQFRRAGLEPLPDGTYFQVAGDGIRNVVGVLPGIDEYVLVTAHYDHVGVRAQGEGDLIRNGANDNASGVASMIEIADALAAGKKPRRTVVFIAFYGEEREMLGSRHYAANPLFPVERTVAQINLEQTGRTDDQEGSNVRAFNVTGFDYSEVASILTSAASPYRVAVVKREKWSDEAFLRSDNEALAKAGVPAHTASVSYIFPDYHRVTDEWPKLDYENMAEVTEAIAAGVLVIANRMDPPRWLIGNPKAAPFADKAAERAKAVAATAEVKPAAPKKAPAKKPVRPAKRQRTAGSAAAPRD